VSRTRAGGDDAGTHYFGFEFTVRKSGDVVIAHHGRAATTLRGRHAQAFLASVEAGDAAAAQVRMARVTGKDKRGNERLARQHPRNARR
jgi:hypothetical protein